MNATSAKVMILVASLILIVFANGLSGSTAVVAAPPADITGTPQEPPTNTPVPPSATPVPPSATPVPPSATPVSPSATPVSPSATPVSPSATPVPTNTPVQQPATAKPAPKRADPMVVKTVDQPAANVGDLIGFSLNVTNQGDATADNVVVTDVLPDYLDLLDVTTSQGTYTVNGKTIVVNVGSIKPGATVLIRIRAYVNNKAPDTGINTASLTTSSSDKNPNNNTSTVTFIVHKSTGSKTSPTMTATPVNEPVIATAVPPTAVPVAEVPSPTRRRVVLPATLPRTGAAEDSSVSLGLLAALGLSIAAVSLLFLRRGKR